MKLYNLVYNAAHACVLGPYHLADAAAEVRSPADLEAIGELRIGESHIDDDGDTWTRIE